MKNAYGISSLARQLKAVAEKLDSLAMGVQDVEQNAPDLTGVYQNLLLDEVEHVQILTLEISMKEMLCELNPDEFACMDDKEREVWLEQFLACLKKK